MTPNYNINDINVQLSYLREQLRTGKNRIVFSVNKNALRLEVASLFGIGQDDFNTENFHRRTLRRFAKLFDVPITDAFYAYPTQDETAWALTNFINRRSDPWSHVRPDPVDTTAAETLAEAPFDVEMPDEGQDYLGER